jgi:hypothetical protein
VEFQQSMEKGIWTAIHIMEQNLQTHDRALQQFIVHVHLHLKLIVQELKEIPKKTRVKSAEGWKEIYSFTLAEWDEQDGKELVRKHMDWIITKLERYADEQDQPDSQEQQALIRKYLEKWLDSWQLLQIVVQGEGMKVACNKVTNDQQITRAAFSRRRNELRDELRDELQDQLRKMAKAANPAFVQEFTLFKPQSDAIPAKVHHFCRFFTFHPLVWLQFPAVSQQFMQWRKRHKGIL